MDSQLIVLDLFLKELGWPLDISSKDSRLRTQKTVYLGQLTGVDLGYRYSWYIHGPYSPNLTQDYYALNSLSESEKVELTSSTLNSATKQKLSKATPLFEIPPSVDLAKPQWLELLSSWHYLRNVTKFDDSKARETIEKQKSHVARFIEDADDILTLNGFMLSKSKL